jgi:hypothetical protein
MTHRAINNCHNGLLFLRIKQSIQTQTQFSRCICAKNSFAKEIVFNKEELKKKVRTQRKEN